jgi:N-acetyl-gamma-glutamyl-phosphate reductase
MNQKISISIWGATGYGGLELIRLLQAHPVFVIKHLIAPQHAGKKISTQYPHLAGICDLTFSEQSPSDCAAESELVFMCLPHGVTKSVINQIIGTTNIVDLSGDFRLNSESEYQTWYKSDHEAKNLLDDFIYCVPEIHGKKIQSVGATPRVCPSKTDCHSELDSGSDAKDAINRRLYKQQKNTLQVANAGCFATAIQLALFPLKDQLKQVSIMAITGSSGSGKKPSTGTHHPLRDKNLKSYKKGSHQHLGEICNSLDLTPKQINFVPTSGPFVRGIFVTAFVDLKTVETLHATSKKTPKWGVSTQDIKERYQSTYQGKPFVRIKDTVQLVDVVGSNFADISVDVINGQVVIQAVIDNTIKGAAGSAIQNANLIFGLDETIGLKNFAPTYF